MILKVSDNQYGRLF